MEVDGRRMEDSDPENEASEGRENICSEVDNEDNLENIIETTVGDDSNKSATDNGFGDICSATRHEHIDSKERVSTETDDGSTVGAAGISRILCDPCGIDGESLLAEGYCVDCDEYLCNTCYRVHCRPSITRHHKLQNVDDMPRVPEGKFKYTTDTCKEHFGQNIEYYCHSDEQFCCSFCRDRKHARCLNVESLSDVLDEYSTGREVNKTIESIESISIDAERLKYQIQANKSAAELFQRKALKEIDECRLQISAHFDKLKKKICKEVNGKMNMDSEYLETLDRKIETMMFDMQTLKSHLRNLQINPKKAYHLFVSVKNTQKKLLECRVELKTTKSSMEINRYTVTKFVHEQTLTEKFSKLGTLENVPSENKIISKCEQTIEVGFESDASTCKIMGMAVLSGNLLVCSDQANTVLKLVDMSETTVLNTLKVASTPNDITKTGERSVAVLLPDDDKIAFVAILKDEQIEIEKEISTNTKYYSISCDERKETLVALSSNDIHFIDFKGCVCRKVSMHVPASMPAYMQTFKYDVDTTTKLIINHDRDVFVILQRSVMIAYNMDGEELGRHYGGTFHGIAIDVFGTLYTCQDRGRGSYSYEKYEVTAINKSFYKEKMYNTRYIQKNQMPTRIRQEPSCMLYSNEGGHLLIAADNSISVFRVA